MHSGDARIRSRVRSVAVTLSIATCCMIVMIVGCRRGDAANESYKPANDLGETGDEVYAVFIGSSTCGATEREGFAAVVEGLKVQLRRRAQEQGLRFATAGVATDWALDEGLAFLHEFGEWDEVLVGRNCGTCQQE